jgi:cytochrome c biogenesis protein CcmG, thiol:disulfide interchange protein DsbE
MNFTQRITLYVLLFIAGTAWTILSAGESASSNSAGTSAPQVGFTAPDFTLKTQSGEIFTLTELRGQAILVNLWATWCPPCRAEMPAIQKVYDEYKDQGFVVLAVDMTAQDNPLDIAPFAKELGLSFPILLDDAGYVSKAYQLRSLPSSYFIDRNGIISEVVIGGPMSEPLLRIRVEKILN